MANMQWPGEWAKLFLSSTPKDDEAKWKRKRQYTFQTTKRDLERIEENKKMNSSMYQHVTTKTTKCFVAAKVVDCVNVPSYRLSALANRWDTSWCLGIRSGTFLKSRGHMSCKIPWALSKIVKDRFKNFFENIFQNTTLWRSDQLETL